MAVYLDSGSVSAHTRLYCVVYYVSVHIVIPVV
jgi:hypothetical protein